VARSFAWSLKKETDVSEKRLTVILYGCDRNLWRGGPLKIRVSDVFASGGPRVISQGQTEEATLELRLALPFDAGQVYGITFAAPQHRPAWQLIRRQDFIRLPENVERDDLVLRLMLVPDAPGTTDLPKGFDRLKQIASPFVAPSGVSNSAFEALEVAAQMAFLNIEAKLRETVLDGTPLLGFVRGVRHVAVDRAFLFFDPGLKARMPRSSEFASAPGHGAPKSLPDLPAHPDSWKHTRFAEGNVQLSFSRETLPLPGGGAASPVHSADVDIDLGRGLAHAKEWLENNVFRPGHKTNQALIYALLYAQGILPKYTLDPVSTTTRSAAALMRPRAATTRRTRKRGAQKPAAQKRTALTRTRRRRSTRR
jgi:hypothetical protein